MNRELWAYELGRIGWPALVGPPLALLAMTSLGALAAATGNAPQVNRILSASLDVLPLVAGIAAANAVSGDAAIELQLSLPTPFRLTVLRRLALAVGWTATLGVTHRLVWPTSLAAGQLIWLVRVAWMTGLGAVLTLGLRGVAIGSGLAGVVWVVEASLSSFFESSPERAGLWLFLRFTPDQSTAWYWNRLELAAFAVALVALACWLLGHTERLLHHES
jgi:hypothetical protein